MSYVREKVIHACRRHCDQSRLEKIIHYAEKKKIILDGLHVDISSNMPNTYYESCEALEAGVKSLTLDLTQIAKDKIETVFLSIRALARGYKAKLYAKGGVELAKYNQFVSLYEIDDYTEFAEMINKNKCDLNKIMLIDRDINCTVYMSALINLPRIDSVDELADVVTCAEILLICQLHNYDYPKCFCSGRFATSLGLNGVHEWLMQRGYPYSINPELEHWLEVYKVASQCMAITDLLDSQGWDTPSSLRGQFPCSYNDTTRGIGILESLAVVERLHKRGILKEDLIAKYSMKDQIEVLEYISKVVDGFIRTEIAISRDIPSDGYIYGCLDTELKELILNFS